MISIWLITFVMINIDYFKCTNASILQTNGSDYKLSNQPIDIQDCLKYQKVENMYIKSFYFNLLYSTSIVINLCIETHFIIT